MTVDTELHEHTLVIKLNRPEAGNALDPDTGRGLVEAFQRAAADDVRAVVLTGAGEKIFCAGMDLKAFAAGVDTAPIGQGIAALRSCEKPVIAAVNGVALAGGFEVMLYCDMAVVAEHARFGLPEVKRGLFAGAAGVYRLPRRLPRNIGLELVATGDPLDAPRAYAMGLVNRLTPPGGVLAAAIALAKAITVNAPVSVQESLRVARLCQDLTEEELDAVAQTAMGRVFSTKDSREGPRAFVEKRPAVWSGE